MLMNLWKDEMYVTSNNLVLDFGGDYGNYGPISYRFRENWLHSVKKTQFSNPTCIGR